MTRIYKTPRFDVFHRHLRIVEETIIELRGNGVVMTVYEIDKETLDFLQDRAIRIGEDLSQLWFDPFFWHNPEMYQIKLGLKKVQEYRGLMNDDISFMEIRRKGKKRKKYLVKELLGQGQLFPMFTTSTFRHSNFFRGKTMICQSVFGTGCLARFKSEKPNQMWDLSKLDTMLSSSQDDLNRTLLFTGYKDKCFTSSFDDFVLRREVLNIYSESNK